MPKEEKYTEKSTSTTKTKEGLLGPEKDGAGEYVKETTTKTEGTVKKDK